MLIDQVFTHLHLHLLKPKVSGFVFSSKSIFPKIPVPCSTTSRAWAPSECQSVTGPESNRLTKVHFVSHECDLVASAKPVMPW